MKRCFKCGVEKPIDDFYRHPMTADGHLGKCKDCTKYDMRVDRHTKPRVRAYDRKRATEPHRIELRRRITKEWRQHHPDWARAQVKAQRAMDKGEIKKLEVCEGCGLRKQRLEKHHPDYARPLLVMWLCKPCHAIADKIRRRMEEVDTASSF